MSNAVNSILSPALPSFPLTRQSSIDKVSRIVAVVTTDESNSVTHHTSPKPRIESNDDKYTAPILLKHPLTMDTNDEDSQPFSVAFGDTLLHSNGNNHQDKFGLLSASNSYPVPMIVEEDKPHPNHDTSNHPSSTSTSTSTSASPPTSTSPRPRPTQSFSDRFRRRKSWLSSSRSPSPNKLTKRNNSKENLSPDIPPPPPPPFPPTSSDSTPSRPSSLTRSLTNKLRSRQSASQTSLDTLRSRSPSKRSISSMHTSYSTDKLSNSVVSLKSSSSTDRLSIPSSTSNHHTQSDFMPTLLPSSKLRAAKKRDELWSSFRDIENARNRFLTKSGEQKAAVIRATLLPFLQETSSHPSNKQLHSEDLERRLSIFHDWWTSLLDFVQTNPFYLMSNQSKHAVYNTIIELMQRSEWKHYPSPYAATNSISVSQEISGDFLLESIQHNINNWYQKCLMKQLHLVIDKMSQRPVAALIAFCAKTCAYAFFYCPQIAQVLIKLWVLDYFTLRRVFDENGFSINADLNLASKETSEVLPDCLSNITFSSLTEAYNLVKSPIQYPIGTEETNWKGPWLARWNGQDSDLFYSFVKYHNILLVDYLPTASKSEFFVAAGGAFIQAQLLINMDATVRRVYHKSKEAQPLPQKLNDGLLQQPEPSSSRANNTTFDDIIDKIDGSFLSSTEGPLPLPTTITNADRLISDNRLLQLLRDILFSQSTLSRTFRDQFACTFVSLLQASTKSTSKYRRTDVECLCNVLEETALILVRYERAWDLPFTFLDWEFWIDVWRRMCESSHVNTEARVFSLIFSLWPAISRDPLRRNELCHNFLLDRKIFESRFLSWSPLIRSFFQRLIAWRVSRTPIGGDDSYLPILTLVRKRLHTLYAHYLHICSKAAEQNKSPPSTAPVPAAPNRRLVIVRAERPPFPSPFSTTAASSTGQQQQQHSFVDPGVSALARAIQIQWLCTLFTSEDGGQGDGIGSGPSDHTSMSAVALLLNLRPGSASTSSTGEALEETPRRWTGLMRSIISVSSRSRSAPNVRSMGSFTGSEIPRSSPKLSPNDSNTHTESGAEEDTNQALALPRFVFRFSLEQSRNGPPLPVTLHAPRLPRAAEALVWKWEQNITQRNDSVQKSSKRSSNPSAHRRKSLSTTSQQDSQHETDISTPAETEAEMEANAGTDLSSTDENNDDYDQTQEDEEEEQKAEDAETDFMSSPIVIAPAFSPFAPANGNAYVGRALAEWMMVVYECGAFASRRMSEGVPSEDEVEVPVLLPEVMSRARDRIG